MTCPSSKQPNSLGCGAARCCDDVSCVVNVAGPCICATYYETSTDVFNYSFVAQCAYNSVTGTPLGTECYTNIGPLISRPYSCYCRPRTSLDVGQVGDQVPGNAIFNWDDTCGFFRTGGSSVSQPGGPSPATGAATSATSSDLGCALVVAPASTGWESSLWLTLSVSAFFAVHRLWD